MTQRTTSLALAFSLAAVALSASITRAEPTAAQPSTQPASRSQQEIMADVRQAGKELRQALKSPKALGDETKRKEIAPKALPAIKKLLALGNELGTSPQGAKLATSIRTELVPMAIALGDQDTLNEVTIASKGSDEAATGAKAALLQAEWLKASSDAAAQGKLLDRAQALAKANTESDTVTQALMMLMQTSADSETGNKVRALLGSEMKSPMAARVKKQLDAQAEAEAKIKATENKPLTIAGTKPDGTAFTTADWKGKVVLVDFWATWCGPCLAELPRVKKAYADYHEKGLEILGVSNDYKTDDLTKFVAADPAMPWPQLFDAAAAAEHKWNPITLGFGINGIPTMFLIDKKGVCRTVEARENFEELIPKLLAE